MSALTYFAPELLQRILQLVPPDTQKICLFVCKSWNTTAKIVYFSQINVFSTTNLSQLISSLQTTGRFVRSLTINTNRKLTYPVLINLIASCLFLQKLKLDSNYCEWVWLSSIELNRLKSVSTCYTSRQCRNNRRRFLYRIAYRFRGSIEELSVPYTGDQTLQQEFDGIMQYLSGFENLKRLCLTHESQNAPTYIYFDTLLNTCKSLEKLEIKLGHPLYPPTAVSSNELTRTDYRSMRQLVIFLTAFSTEYLQYIMDRFSSIIKLDVRIKQLILDGESDMQEICYFMQHKYIPFIKTLSRSSLIINVNDPSALGDLSAGFFTAFKELKTVCFKIRKNRSEETNIKVVIEQGSPDIYFSFLRNFSPADNNLNSPYIPHLTTYGHIIKSLEIKTKELIDLKIIMDKCRKLQKLTITQPMYLQVADGHIIPTIDVRKTGTSNLLYSTLAQLTITGSNMISLDLFNFLSSYAYNLKTLIFKNCSVKIDLETPFLFDISNLKFLQVFELDAQYFYSGSSIPSTCLLIEVIIVGDPQIEYYLSNGKRVRKVRPQERTSTDATTLKFKFSSSVKIKISAGGIITNE